MIYFEVTGTTELIAAFENLQARLQPPGLTRFLQGSVDPYLRDRAEERFVTQGVSGGTGRWAPLLRATRYIRAAKGFPGAAPINRRTGELMNYVANTSSTRVTSTSATLTKPALGGGRELQNKLSHAQLGGVGPSGNPYPARPVLNTNERDLTAVLNRLQDYLSEAIETARP